MPFMTDSVFKNMKEKAYFLKPTCWKPGDFSKMLKAQTSATRTQFYVIETGLVPRSADRAGILTPLLTRLMTLSHLCPLSGPQFLSL